MEKSNFGMGMKRSGNEREWEWDYAKDPYYHGKHILTDFFFCCRLTLGCIDQSSPVHAGIRIRRMTVEIFLSDFQSIVNGVNFYFFSTIDVQFPWNYFSAARLFTICIYTLLFGRACLGMGNPMGIP